MNLDQAIAQSVAGGSLEEADAASVFGQIMDAEATETQIKDLLLALGQKGETLPELVGAARAMRTRAVRLSVPGGVVVDVCGTGGDGHGTLNVSTLAALVAAAAGVRVAKHGNRAVSSLAGSADLLEALGLPTSPTVATHEYTLAELGLCFLFAPDFHHATRHAAPARRALGVRTIFNLLGPLTNPALVRRQVVGVWDASRLELVASALGALGSERALVVHGGGLDELAPRGPTEVAELRGGMVHRYTLCPSDFGLSDHDPSGLAGGDAAENARLAMRLLAGELGGAARSSVVMTAAAALWMASDGAVDELPKHAATAAAALDDGRAERLLQRLRETLVSR